MTNKWWECPKCGNCYSPMQFTCTRCNVNYINSSTTTTCTETWEATYDATQSTKDQTV